MSDKLLLGLISLVVIPIILIYFWLECEHDYFTKRKARRQRNKRNKVYDKSVKIQEKYSKTMTLLDYRSDKAQWHATYGTEIELIDRGINPFELKGIDEYMREVRVFTNVRDPFEDLVSLELIKGMRDVRVGDVNVA